VGRFQGSLAPRPKGVLPHAGSSVLAVEFQPNAAVVEEIPARSLERLVDQDTEKASG